MADGSAIEWTEATWNPILGCTKVSEGCDHCYAERLASGRLRRQFPGGFGAVRVLPDRVNQPLRWRKPRRVFVNSLSDLFHDRIHDEWIAEIFGVMAATPVHTYQVLTKRPGRMRALLSSETFAARVEDRAGGKTHGYDGTWPLPNVWLGTSVENQKWADVRIPKLLETPAAVRFLSCEPLLGPVNLGAAVLRPYERQQGGFWEYGHGEDVHGNGKTWIPAPPAQIDWVIVGGESGPGARPMELGWARELVDQCLAAGVAPFVKQLGTRWSADSGHGRRHGGDMDLWPADLRVRQYPEGAVR